ncbi:MAG TPA: glycogen phosphorylase, partial [Spirochaetia bacterium]|nr:glycogen phosphorylase [Spirochaetia bacterium]
FSPDAPERFKPLANNLLGNGDYYMLLADFRSYCNSQDEVNRTYKDQTLWNTKSIINVANMGKFSTDRTISQYAKEIWDIKPAKVII